MTASLFLGRFQPFHSGHIGIVRKLLAEGRTVVIGIRDGPFDAKNMFSLGDRIGQIRTAFPDRDLVNIVVIPDFDEVITGRTPGWKYREVLFEEDIETPSGTSLRLGRVIWFTGRSGAGKTTLALELKRSYFPSAIILDADEVRAGVSEDLGLSNLDRVRHNRRMAEMAKIISVQGHIVIATSVSPTVFIRNEITKIADPIWVHVGGGLPESECHYEVPEAPDVHVKNPMHDYQAVQETCEELFKQLRGRML